MLTLGGLWAAIGARGGVAGTMGTALPVPLTPNTMAEAAWVNPCGGGIGGGCPCVYTL